MNKIVITLEVLQKQGLTINEYLVLYNIVNDYSISTFLDYGFKELISLEDKGFVKLIGHDIHLRDKTTSLFSINETDLFAKWLKTYPVKVTKKFGGSRSLSPASDDTILGQKLKKKWSLIFKKDVKAQEKAIKVLEYQLEDMKKSGDLEYMVEAARWLNEGYHEKYSYLVDEGRSPNKYKNEDYL
jgi:hypothetical protein